MTRRAGKLRKQLLLAAGSLLVFVLPLGAAELALRWSGRVQPTPEWERAYHARALSLLQACDLQPVMREPPTLREGQSAPERVIVIGESSAGMLARSLATLGGSCGVEVMDCAQGGASLEHVEIRLEQALAQRPDTLLLLFGHNLEHVFPTNRVQLWLEAAASHSRLLRWLVGSDEPDVPVMDEAQRLEALDRFLTDAAHKARQQDVRLMLATPIGNPWFAPTASSSEQERLVLRARYLIATGRRAEALAGLEASGSEASALFERAIVAAEEGDTGTAEALLAESLVLSGSHTNRATPDVYDLIRRAAERLDLTLVDGARLAHDWYGPALDWRHFVDACHPTDKVFDRYGEATLDALLPSGACEARLSAEGAPDPILTMLAGVLTLDPEDPVFRAWSRSVAVAVPQWLRARPDVDEVIVGWLALAPTREAPANHRSRVMAALAHGFTRAGLPERASALRAQAPAPEGPVVAVEWALWLLEQGQVTQARAELAPFAAQTPASWLLSWLDADERSAR